MRMTVSASLTLLGLALSAGPLPAVDISGTIASTLTIMENSQLVGTVECTFDTGPCIQFGASNIKLRLNGFKMRSWRIRVSDPARDKYR